MEQSHADTPVEDRLALKADSFRLGIRALSETAEALLRLLRQQQPDAPVLSSVLMQMLKELRQQRALALDLALVSSAGFQADEFVQSLATLRAKVAQWFTIQASQTKFLAIEATEFEMQCFGTLGAGVVWLDSINNDAVRDSLISDEKMLSLLFNTQSAQAEDITEQVHQEWGDYHTQAGHLN